MKRNLLAILVIIIILICGCSKDIDSIESETKPIVDESSSERIDIYYPKNKRNVPPEDFILDWQAYMLSKHNLDIKLTYTEEHSINDVLNGTITDAGVSISNLVNSITDGGFIYVGNSTENIRRIKNSGLVVPVNDYIQKIPSIAVLDEKILGMFSDSSDEIWAIPLSTKIGAPYRLYNNEWIKQWEKGLPDSIEEFREYAEYVRFNDPDDNGEDDSYIQSYRSKYVMQDFRDVFRAFGCYTDTGTPVSYNPLTETYENVLFNENFVNAISYIKNLKDEGLIIESSVNEGQQEDEPYYVATTNGSVVPFKDCSEFAVGFYITGPNDEKLIRAGNSSWCLMVAKDTENVSEKLELLLNNLRSSSECWLDFMCGIKGISYQENENFYSYYYYEDESMTKRVPMIGISSPYHFDSFKQKPIVVGITKEALNVELSRRDIIVWEKFNDASVEAGKHELAYSISHFLDNNEVRLLNAKIRHATEYTLDIIMKGEVTVDVGIAQYDTLMELEGIYINDEIAELNDMIIPN